MNQKKLMDQNKKIGIICTGGGMRCAYGGGALVALAKEYGCVEPHSIIGISGGAGSMAYYLAKQYEEIEKIWVDLLSTKDFLSFRRVRKIMDIDYLIDIIFKRLTPLNLDNVLLSTTAWHIPVTDTLTRKTYFFDKKDGKDLFEILRAAKALPLVYGKQVAVNTSSYFDGGLSVSYASLFQKMEEDNVTHIIFIDNAVKGRAYTLLKKIIYKKVEDNHGATFKNIPIIRISNNELSARLLTRDRAILKKTFDEGYSDIKNSLELQKLFGTAKK